MLITHGAGGFKGAPKIGQPYYVERFEPLEQKEKLIIIIFINNNYY